MPSWSDGELRVVVLDLDGTLIDSRMDIAIAANFALAELGRPALPIEQISSFVGDGALELVRRATGFEHGDPRLAQALRSFREYYTAHAVVHTRPYAGVMQTLGDLRKLAQPDGARLALALCTNKPRAPTEAVLRGLGLDGLLDLVTAADDFTNKKPHPEALLFIAETFGVAPSQLVMVGDGPQDIECARRAGAFAVGVTYGFNGAEVLRDAGADELLDDFSELPRVLGLG